MLVVVEAIKSLLPEYFGMNVHNCHDNCSYGNLSYRYLESYLILRYDLICDDVIMYDVFNNDIRLIIHHTHYLVHQSQGKE